MAGCHLCFFLSVLSRESYLLELLGVWVNFFFFFILIGPITPSIY